MENINDDFSVLDRLTDIKPAMKNLPTTAKDTEFFYIVIILLCSVAEDIHSNDSHL